MHTLRSPTIYSIALGFPCFFPCTFRVSCNAFQWSTRLGPDKRVTSRVQSVADTRSLTSTFALNHDEPPTYLRSLPSPNTTVTKYMLDYLRELRHGLATYRVVVSVNGTRQTRTTEYLMLGTPLFAYLDSSTLHGIFMGSLCRIVASHGSRKRASVGRSTGPPTRIRSALLAPTCLFFLALTFCVLSWYRRYAREY